MVNRSRQFARGCPVAVLAAVEFYLEDDFAVGISLGKEAVQVEFLRLDKARIVYRPRSLTLFDGYVGVNGTQVGGEGAASREVAVLVGDVAVEPHVAQPGDDLALFAGECGYLGEDSLYPLGRSVDRNRVAHDAAVGGIGYLFDGDLAVGGDTPLSEIKIEGVDVEVVGGPRQVYREVGRGPYLVEQWDEGGNVGER